MKTVKIDDSNNETKTNGSDKTKAKLIQKKGGEKHMARTSSNRGLASADEETRRRVAKKGGEAVSRNRKHMAEIGSKGGRARSR